jgi:hypothetical protein
MRGLSRSIAVTARAVLAAIATLACGSGGPEIPSELLQGDCNCRGAYPAGPYLADVGATLQDFEFEGFREPAAPNGMRLERIRISDFYDPNGDRGVALLLVNTAAVWCQSCRVEHRTLSARQEQFRSRGLVVFSALFQDAQGDPAMLDDLSLWTEQFRVTFPMALDPEFQLGRYASAETAPLNLLVDASSMTILERYIGDQEAVIWPRIEAELAARGR